MKARRRISVAGVALAAFLALPAGAGAAPAPPPLDAPAFSGFRSVLAQGEGQTINATDLAAFEATGTAPDSFVSQQPLYVGVMPAARTLTSADLNTYYKDTDFGSMPGGTASLEEPRPGVHIYRDATYGMAHIYGDSRYDVMFGAGYATAEERLFLMDALRRTAKGTLAGLVGASAAEGDGEQLTDQDFSNAELTKQFDALPKQFGTAGARAHSDILAYIDGINARISEDKLDPTKMPAEYAALGASPEPWTVSDTAALAVLLVTQFTVSNGGEQVNAILEQGFQKQFGKSWRKPYGDFREAQDPEAFVVAKRPFHSDDPGPVRPGMNVVPKLGSITSRNAVVSGPSAADARAQRAELPGWVQSLERLRGSLPPVESNAVMVTLGLSSDGHAIAAMGPQVGYYSPQIFSEYELHGGGIDAEGVSFPGASPYPLIGHGIDFAWSGTSANGDNEDTFAEELCNPDGSPATKRSTHYLYRGHCRSFTMREQSVTTPVAPTDPQPAQTITYRTMRSVHGPVFAFAKANGVPIALAKAKAVDFHELDAVIPFMRLAENVPSGPRSFQKVMGKFPGTENWFYVDRRNVAFIQSGRYPRHAPGSDLDLPFRGTGNADWQGFDPSKYTFKSIAASHRPRAVNPKDGFIISWNNKEALGWRKGPREWSNGPVHRALILKDKLFQQVRKGNGHVDLTGLTRAVNLAATTDLRGQDLLPWMLRVIAGHDGSEGQALDTLRAWHRSGSNRLDADGDNVYDHSAAVALMDAWWPRFVTAEFRPGLGPDVLGMLEDNVLSLDGDFGWDWGSAVSKDLRDVLAAPEKGRLSRVYCGGPRTRPRTPAQRSRAMKACRKVLLSTLADAQKAVAKQQGTSQISAWKVLATCDSGCDQIEPNTAGAVDTPAFPWQNRGTYHQITEVGGHR